MGGMNPRVRLITVVLLAATFLLATVPTSALAISTQTASRQRAPSTSPAAVARAYALALVSGNLRDFWSLDTVYLIDVDAYTNRFPKSMWPQKIREVQQRYINQIEEDRAAHLIFHGRPWNLFLPGSRIEILETRSVTQERRTSWKVFMRITYASPKQSPVLSLNRSSRRIRQVVASIDVVRDEKRRRLVATRRMSVVDETVYAWESAGFDNKLALALANGAVPRKELPLIKFTGFSRYVMSDQVRTILRGHGVSITPRGDDGAADYGLPASWGKYQFGSDSIYTLCGELKLETTDARKVTDDMATATVHIKCVGSNPVAELIKALKASGNPGGLGLFENFTSFDGYRYAEGDLWRDDTPFVFNYKYDSERGWFVLNSRYAR